MSGFINDDLIASYFAQPFGGDLFMAYTEDGIVNFVPVSDIPEYARRRHELHGGKSSRRIFSEDYEIKGLVGEVAFSQEFNVPVDLVEKAFGDGGIDFIVNGHTIDVKTYDKPYNLLREVGKPHAQIIVLAGYKSTIMSAELIGWEYDTEMLKCPKADFGHGVLNHYKAARKLRRITELKEVLGNIGL